MIRAPLLLLSICLIIGINAERVRYDNYRVYKVQPITEQQVKILKELDAHSDSVIFLESPHQVSDEIDIVVAPHKVNDFVLGLEKNLIPHTLLESNAQSKLDVELEIRPRFSGSYNWAAYHTLEETYDWLEQLAQKYPQVELVNAGKTYEGREIRGVKVSYKSGNKGVFVEGGIHAREWIAPATTTYILNELLTSNNSEVRNIAENYDWYFIPHANPDGYAYTHNKDRLWRKTRSPNGMCYGADPNRNWGFHWNEVGSSSNPCSDTYAGKSAFSEIETKTLSEYITTLQGKITTYISFHSFSQLLLWPYGHTRDHAKNHKDLKQIGDASMRALAKRYGTKYRGGNIYDAIYPASGASVDWAYGVLDVPLSYCYELRPASGGWNGFVLPPKQIIPTGEEMVDAIVALLQEAKNLKY